MKPPVIPEPYVAPPASKPVSPFKVICIIFATLSVLGVLLVGSLAALAYGVYWLRKPEWDQPVAARPPEDPPAVVLRNQASQRTGPPYVEVDLVKETFEEREARIDAAVVRLEQPVVSMHDATELAEHGDWIDFQRVLNGMRDQTIPSQGTREQLQKLADLMQARVEPYDGGWALDDMSVILKWQVRVGLLDENGKPTLPSGAPAPAPAVAKTAATKAPPFLSSGDLFIKPAAATKLRAALQDRPVLTYVLIGVDVAPKTCTGLAYRMTVEPRPSLSNYCIGSINGIPIAVEREGYQRLRGSTLDFAVVSDTVQGFVFNNPNATLGSLSTPDETKVTAAAAVAPAAKVTETKPAVNESLTAQVARVRQPIADVEEAIRLADHGDIVDYQRVLFSMEQDQFFPGATREQHEKLAAAMEEKLEAAGNRNRSSDQKIIRTWRSRAAQARLNGGVLPPQTVEEPVGRTSATSGIDRFRERLQTEVDESFLPPRQTESADAILRRMRERMDVGSSPADPLVRMRERQRQYETERRQREAEHQRRIEEILEQQREMVRRATQPPTFP